MRLHVSMDNEAKATLAGSASLGTIGGVIGSSMGIAAFGTAIAATIPFAITGVVLGGLVGSRLAKGRNRS